MEENKVIENQDESLNSDELKGAIEETLSKIRRQSMLLGAQSMANMILEKIIVFERVNNKKSNNDHKRLKKDIKKLCENVLSRQVDFGGETDENNTKLTDGDV